jgi:Domain of unknown function (DUF4926)
MLRSHDMIQELDVVVLVRALPNLGLRAGESGTAVMVLGEGEAYIVEFMNASGDTTAIETIQLSDLRLARADETTSSRQVA